LEIPKIWAYGRGNGCRVAVLDTGIQTNHPEFAGAIGEVHNFINDTDDVRDFDGHGTHCAGIIAARGVGKTIGIAGECKLLIGKIMEDWEDGFADATLAKAIEWATRSGAHVISLSLYNPNPLPLTDAAIAKAVLTHKIAVVAAIGNDENRSGFNPAMNPHCISVGALDGNLALTSYTSRFSKLTVTAPGEQIFSTGRLFDLTDFPREGYETRRGTSAATPFVSALVAIIKANNKKADPGFIKDQIFNSADVRTAQTFPYRVINPKNLFKGLTV
jgi:subtilisin family serine protease